MAENTIIHEISLAGYKATSTGGMLDLGTWGSYGIEKLHLTLDAAWQDLTITAFFNVKGEVVAKKVVRKDGYADVPWEATKENTFAGRIVFEGSMNNQRRISANLNFKVTNHSEFEDSDPVPTDDRWNQFVTQNKEYRDGAFEAAERANARAEDAEAASDDAQAAARAAKASENAAAASASNAAAEAAKAGPYAKAAQTAQEAAENAAASAAASESAADTLAAKAERAAQEAENSNTAANNAAYLAGENATAAQKAAVTATAAANDAGQSASAAAASKAAAETAAKAAQNAQTTTAEAKAEAVKAQGAAQTAAKSAQDAQAAAENVRDDAQTAQQGAEAARDAAAKSAEAAAKSEANAKQSADTLAESVENVVANTAAVAELKQQVKNITPDDSSIGDAPWSSKHIIDMLCPPLEESGNPVVCYPVAGYALGVKASWEPVQEGSGTPYPAGGGKNQLNPAGYEAATKTVNGITFTRLNTGEVVINGTATGTAIYVLIANFSYLVSLSTDRNWSIAGENVIFAQGLVSGVTVIRPSDNTSLYIRVQSGTTVKTTVQPQIEKGNTPTAWAPYENIRPIKGRDSVAVERCGENLLNIKLVNEIVGRPTIKNDNGWLQVDGELQGGNLWLAIGYVLRTGTYCAYLFGGDSMQDNGVLWIYGDVQALMGPKQRQAILTVKNTSKVNVYLHVNSSFTLTTKFAVAIVSGSTAPTTYTPYIGQTNTLTLPETVYEGEVDAVNGEGQETWKMLTLDGTTNKFTQSDRFWRMQSNTAPGVVNGYATMCSHFPANTFGGNQTGNYIFTRADIMSRYFPDVNALNTYIAAQYAAGTPVQICYKLAEPVSFTATGAQPIPALAGANTVLTDADSATVTGRADPIKRITDLEDAVASQT